MARGSRKYGIAISLPSMREGLDAGGLEVRQEVLGQQVVERQHLVDARPFAEPLRVAVRQVGRLPAADLGQQRVVTVGPTDDVELDLDLVLAACSTRRPTPGCRASSSRRSPSRRGAAWPWRHRAAGAVVGAGAWAPVAAVGAAAAGAWVGAAAGAHPPDQHAHARSPRSGFSISRRVILRVIFDLLGHCPFLLGEDRLHSTASGAWQLRFATALIPVSSQNANQVLVQVRAVAQDRILVVPGLQQSPRCRSGR